VVSRHALFPVSIKRLASACNFLLRCAMLSANSAAWTLDGFLSRLARIEFRVSLRAALAYVVKPG